MNPRDLWKTLKTVLPNKNNSYNVPSEMNANSFNEFFTTIGENVTKSIPSVMPVNQSNPEQQGFKAPSKNFNFLQISTSTVYKKILELKTSTYLDILELDTFLLKECAHLIAPSLTHVFNLSLHHGTLPIDFKIARTTPVFKNKGSITDVSNYRPISVISHISKLLESIVKQQLLTHLIEQQLLSKNQFAYIKGRSTETALHKIIDNWLNNIDNGKITGTCFLDLSKCFDTVSHSILLEKLPNYGIIDIELNWFKSYLTDRQQLVKCNGKLSKLMNLSTGIPQGTILGPILFVLYANDIFHNLSEGTCIMYADDITLFVSGSSINQVQQRLQICVNETYTWLNNNKLLVNTSKSNTMLIGTKKRTNNCCLNIYINNALINYTDNFNLLGVYIDSDLSWKTHISHLAKKISSKIGLIKRLKPFLPNHIIQKLYSPFIQSNIDYCLTIWGRCAATYLDLIRRLQNRAAPVISNNYNREISSLSLCKKFGWMTISQRQKYLDGCLMFKYLRNKDFYNFKYVNNSHNHQTRLATSKSLLIPKPNTTYFKHSFIYSVISLWNGLPSFIKSATNLKSFKSVYKQYILNNF